MGIRAALALTAICVSSAALAYLPPPDVRVELVEFKAQGKTLQGAFFAPDPLRFPPPRRASISS